MSAMDTFNLQVDKDRLERITFGCSPAEFRESIKNLLFVLLENCDQIDLEAHKDDIMMLRRVDELLKEFGQPKAVNEDGSQQQASIPTSPDASSRYS